MSKSKAVGGYFELELPESNGHYYPEALKYQSARSAFHALLLHLKPKKVRAPYFICDSIVSVLKGAGVDVDFYSINSDFTVKDDIKLEENDILFYVNYFGICSRAVEQLLENHDPEKIVIDNSQAFFSPPKACLATIYSPRKFFGVPDGGYLITKLPIQEPETVDQHSIVRCTHLMRRLAGEPEDGYMDYQIAERSLSDIEPRRMSFLTDRLLSSIDYEFVKNKRKSNFLNLHNALKNRNKFDLKLEDISGPMVYPAFIGNGELLRSNLLSERLFVATYWPEVLARVQKNSFEWNLVTNGLFLPCDQRYNKDDMVRLVSNLGVKL